MRHSSMTGAVVLCRLALVGALLTGTVAGCDDDASRSTDNHAAPAPADLCALVEESTVARLVPNPKSPERYTNNNVHVARAACTIESLPKDGEQPFGSIGLDLYRSGSASSSTPEREAMESFARQRDELTGRTAHTQVGDIGGLGDEAYATTDAYDGDRGAQAELLVRRGADVLTITIISRPSTPAASLAEAKKLAAQIFDRL